jgi:hypothetical protein
MPFFVSTYKGLGENQWAKKGGRTSWAEKYLNYQLMCSLHIFMDMNDLNLEALKQDLSNKVI